MARHIHNLTRETLPDLPAACRACVFWELPAAPRGPQRGREEEVLESKEVWYRAIELELGSAGKVLYEDDTFVGYALVMTSEHARRVRRLGSTVSDDAMLLATLWIDPKARDGGLAKVLLQSVLRHAHGAGFRAVEAVGQRTVSDVGWCILPEGFLIANGFVVHHEHRLHPLLRLDLRRTARWQDAMEHALEGVRSMLRGRERQPAPSPRGAA